MRCSLIIPTYRRPDSLRRCLRSALSQTRPPDELIVVTRVGDDESERVVADASEEGARLGIRLLHARVEAPGLIRAQNAGLLLATGEIVSFTDDDAVLPPTWLARVEEHFADDSVGAVGGRDRIIREHPVDERATVVGKLTRFGRLIGNHHKVVAGGPREVDHLKGCNMSYRRALSPLLDPNLIGVDGTELDLCLRVREAGRRVIYDPFLVVDHYPAPRPDLPPRMTPVTSYESSHNLLYCAWKHFPLWRRLVVVAYMVLVGQGDCYGLAKLVTQLRKDGPALAWRKFFASVTGVFRGAARAVGARGGAA